MSANSHQDQPPRVRLDGEVVGLLLLVVAFLLGLILFLPLLGDQGGALVEARRVLLDWAGWVAWLLPAAAFAYGVAAFTNAPHRELTRWVLGGLLATFAVMCLQAFFIPGQNGHPGPAGWIAEGLVRKLKQVLGLATPLLLLLGAALGLKFMLGVSLLGLVRKLVHWLLGLLTGVGHNVQGAIEARLPGSSGGAVTAHDRTDVRGQLSKLRGELDALRRIDPKNGGLKEPYEKVRRLQRDIRSYDDEQLKRVQDDLTTYSLMSRNALLQAAHDLRVKVEQEAVPEGEEAVRFLKTVVDDRRHELSVFLPSTQASAALEHLRRHLVNQILSIGGKAKRLESERCASERALKQPSIEVLQREQSAHHKRQQQWQDLQDRFQGWHAYEQAYAGWPDLAAEFDSGPTEAATQVAAALQKRPLDTLRDPDHWREVLEQATEEERRRQSPPPADDAGNEDWQDEDEEGGEHSGGLLSRLGHKLGRLVAPPGPEKEETPAPHPAPAPDAWDEPDEFVASPHPVYDAATVPALDIDFGAAPRRAPVQTERESVPPARSQSRARRAAPAPLLTPDAGLPGPTAPATTPPARFAQPPVRPDTARPPAPTPADLDPWDDEEDMPFGPPAAPALRPSSRGQAARMEAAASPAAPSAAAPPSAALSPRPGPAPSRKPAPAPWEEAVKAERPVPRSATERGSSDRETTERGISRRGAIRLALPGEKLLDPIPNAAKNTVQMDTAARQRGDMIDETLRHFGLQARVVDMARGPTVTRYEIEPAPGEKISRIASLSNDLARALAVGGVRVEAPVPGKSVIGLEVPNAEREPVTFHQAAASAAFKTARAKLPIILGKSIDGSMMVGDLAKMPHLLVAGSTGSGKSVCVNTLITSLLYRYLPTELRFVMIDPKMVELTPYDGIPHLVRPVVTNPADAAGVLLGAVAHMERRYKMMSGVGAKNLEQFNAKMRAVGEVELPHLVIIIDELADLMITSPKEVESAIMRLAQMARATGMHLILATQRPSVDILTSLIKVNIPARIAFAVSSSHDSRTILDTTGAERLTGQGDMLFYQPGLVKPLRLQGPYISEAESVRIADELRRMMFDDEFVEAYGSDFEGLISSSGPGGDRSQMDFSDPLLRQAALVCIEEGQGSVSRLQRRLSVGHARAGKLMDLLEAMNIVGPHQGSKPREVLISEADLPEYFGK